MAGCALGAVVLYAISDELHQYFVANRTASVRDVGIDTLGGTIGLGLLWVIYRNRASAVGTVCGTDPGGSA